MPKFLAQIWEQVKTWLFNNGRFLLFWYSKTDKAIELIKQSDNELPPPLRAKLVEATENLSINENNLEAISSAVDSAFEKWMNSAEGMNNSIVILSSPVTPVALILSASIEQWAKQKDVSMRLLPWNERPSDFTDIASKLEHSLESKSNELEKAEIVVIPNLCWCFLRSLDGLEGIDYLQSLLLKDSTPQNTKYRRFWIIGAEQTAWKYLDYVCNLKAYCGQSFVLPRLKGEELQEWLEPVVSELEIQFCQPNSDEENEEEGEDAKTKYFNKLADVSEGVSTVALEVFKQSISHQTLEEETENEENLDELLAKKEAENKEETDEETTKSEKSLITINPSLPKLPFLEASYLYILYSLLLHQNLTLSALAESLGDESSEVQAKVQILRRQNIIRQEKEVLQINPLYYPQLKQELANNNFIIEE